MSLANRVKLKIVDQVGKSCDTSFYVDGAIHDLGDTGIVAIQAAIINLISGGTQEDQIEIVDNGNLYGTGAATGYNAADKIRCVCRSVEDGSTVIIDLPGPATTTTSAAAVFHPDGTVNRSAAEVIALVNFINTNGLDSDANHIVFVSGYRVRSDRLRTAF